MASTKKADAVPVSPSRRRIGMGLAAAAAGAAFGVRPLSAQTAVASRPRELSGTEFDLRIGETPVNITGARRTAVTVNGSLPAPLLRWKEGTTVTLRVTNTLPVSTSIHWHGILLPFEMDGVPGVSFNGIEPGSTFVYRFAVKQSGTYWYHSHSAFQEQLGLYGPLIVDPAGSDPVAVDRDHVVLLSDWTDEVPERIFEKLKAVSDYYNYQMPTVGDFFRDVRRMGFAEAVALRRQWGGMRMNPTDLADLSAATYTYLMNGQTPAQNWFALARAGEKVRLRLINASASSIFDVRIPGLTMTVVSADGQPVHPVGVEEIRISTAETYDVVVSLPDNRPYTIFAQAIDRMGFARGTLGQMAGQQAEVPRLDPSTWLTMEDMGMGQMHDMSSMSGGQPVGVSNGGGGMPGQGTNSREAPASHQGHEMSPAPASQSRQAPSAPAMPGHDMSSMPGQPQGAGMPGHDMSNAPAPSGAASMDGMAHGSDMKMDTGPAVDNRAMDPQPSVTDPGPRLRGNGRRVLTYADLRTVGGPIDHRPPSREIVLRLTGNMRRYIWGFDGKKYSQADPVRLRYGERVLITLINDTMMSHPIHLHGMWSEVVGPEGQFLVRKHTVNVHPGKRLSYLVSADALGPWAYHCHHLYHMEAGMFRKVIVE